ncbi:twin-arginine translocase TatA/TatE family subunit [Rathayibacter oskolensis]|uniref:twin-arginine translocase TatA/TatE family subunit n=1 Tax=Rathayibacter oskolensis TaxID=1891671 RepID=UPI0034679ADB
MARPDRPGRHHPALRRRKLPQLARGLGQSIRIFRTETRDLRDPEPDEPAPAGTDGAATAPHGEQTAATRVDTH